MEIQKNTDTHSMNTKRSIILLSTALIAVGCLASGLVSASAPLITETISTPTAFPNGIVTTSDGSVWFTEQTNNKIGFVASDGTGYQHYPQAPNPNLSPSSRPEGIAVGPDGNLWFTENNQDKIGVIGTNGVLINEYAVNGGASPLGIAVGPDGNLWFAEHGTPAIGTIHPDGSNYADASTTLFNPTNITSSNGDLWFTESNSGNTSSAIGEIATNGAILHQYQTIAGNADPLGITSDTSGDIWFAEAGRDKIGEMNPSNGALIKEISLKSGAAPSSLVFGADGNLWFTETGGDAIGTVAPDGSGLQEYSITAGSAPLNITAGTNRNLWFTEPTRNIIGRVQIPAPVVTTSNSTQGSSNVAPKSPATGVGKIAANPVIALLLAIVSASSLLLLSRKFSSKK